MFNLERAHFLVDEMVMNGHIVEANKRNIMTPIERLPLSLHFQLTTFRSVLDKTV